MVQEPSSLPSLPGVASALECDPAAAVTFIAHDFVIWTTFGTDIPGNPWLGTLADAQAMCASMPDCTGFSRLKCVAHDDANAENWFKQVNGPRSRGHTWQTFVKYLADT